MHTGVNPISVYYYKAFAYDEVPELLHCRLSPQRAEEAAGLDQRDRSKTTTDGNLDSKGSWVKVGTADAAGWCRAACLRADRQGRVDGYGSHSGIAHSRPDRIQDKEARPSGLCTLTFDLALDGASGTDGEMIGYVTIYGTTSSTELARVHILKGRAVAGVTLRARVFCASSAANNTWYPVKLEFDIATAERSKAYFNGRTRTRTAGRGRRTNMSYIVLSSDRNTDLSTQKAWVDNLKLEPTPSTCRRRFETTGPILRVCPNFTSRSTQFSVPAVTNTASGPVPAGSQIRDWTAIEITDVLATGLTSDGQHDLLRKRAVR